MDFEKLNKKFIEIGKEVPTKGGSHYYKKKEELNEIFPKLLIASKNEKKYFSGSPLEAYKPYFQNLLETEKNESIEFYYPGFIKREYHRNRRYLEKYNSSKGADGFYLNFLNKENERLSRTIINKRLNYLETEMFRNGIEVIKSSDEYGIMRISFSEKIPQRVDLVEDGNGLIDLSSTIGTEKIIYLNELGIIDFLRDKEPFKFSTNSMATVISAITGINPQTVQSYINPITNPEAGQKNNPLNSNKKVESIKQTLINMGFKP